MSRGFAPRGAALVLLLFAPRLSPAQEVARVPMGVFAHLDIETAKSRYPGPGKPTAAQMHAYLRQLYASLLTNRAISGITAGQRWDKIQLTNNGAAGYDWSYMDDIFAEAHATRKSVQVNITPGFDAPPWLLAQIPT